MTTTRLHTSAITPRLCEISRMAVPCDLVDLGEQLEDLGFEGDVERRGDLVGDQQRGLVQQRDGDHDALAHAARELVGMAVEALGGVGDADPGKRFGDPLAQLALGLVVARVGALRGDHLLADGERRVETGERVLKDHGDGFATQSAQLAQGEAGHVAPFDEHVAAGEGAVRRQQAHQGGAQRRFAAARLADHADDLAPAHLEADVGQRRQAARVGVVDDLKVFDTQERRGGGAPTLRGGSVIGPSASSGSPRARPRAWGRGRRAAPRRAW